MGAIPGAVQQGTDPVDLRGRFAEADVLEDVDAGGKLTNRGWLVGGQFDVRERLPIPDQQPCRVVLAWLHAPHQLAHSVGGGALAGQDQRELASRALRRIPAPGRWPVGQARDHAVLVDRQPGPTGQVVPSAEDPW